MRWRAARSSAVTPYPSSHPTTSACWRRTQNGATFSRERLAVCARPAFRRSGSTSCPRRSRWCSLRGRMTARCLGALGATRCESFCASCSTRCPPWPAGRDFVSVAMIARTGTPCPSKAALPPLERCTTRPSPANNVPRGLPARHFDLQARNRWECHAPPHEALHGAPISWLCQHGRTRRGCER